MIFSLIFGMIRALWDGVFDPVKPRPPLPPADGRFFVWYRARNTRAGMIAGIMRDEKVVHPLEYVGEKHVLSPAEYGDTIAELMKRYPAPTIEE